jgi:ubiquitin carboxyl-terminal hydrolase 25/28
METAPPPLPPRRRFSTAKEEALEMAQAKARQQQDVTEVHDAIMFRLRCGMKARGHDTSEEQEDALRDLFSIHIEETAVNNGVQQTPKLLADSNIQLNVPYEATDIYSALDAVFDLQPYGENPAMETFKSIRALPPLLQINIPRIGYDANRAGGAYKSTECVKLDDELYLDRYFDYSNEDILPKRRQCWVWRKRLQMLRMEQKIVAKTPLDLDGPTTVAQTAAYLASLDAVNAELQSAGVEPIEADGDITSALATDAQEQAARVNELESEMAVLQKNLDAQFTDMKEVKYRLAAVFFHRGAHGHGHYWIYIHDFANNIWRMYNDERVEEFTKLNEIFEANTWQQGTPTYAVYVAEDQIDLVQAVCRDPEQAPPVDDTPQLIVEGVEGDVQMGNAESQSDSVVQTIDPKLISEGGQGSWDTTRQVAAGNMW